jgi:hypothetical protein
MSKTQVLTGYDATWAIYFIYLEERTIKFYNSRCANEMKFFKNEIHIQEKFIKEFIKPTNYAEIEKFIIECDRYMVKVLKECSE